MFAIKAEPENRLICLKFSGFITMDIACQFEAEIQKQIELLRASGPWFDLLVDLTEAQPVTQDVSDKNRKMMTRQIEMGLRKSANIVSSALTAMQLRRTAGSDKFQTFTTEEAARAWLAET